jgi:hypothetical protein
VAEPAWRPPFDDEVLVLRSLGRSGSTDSGAQPTTRRQDPGVALDAAKEAYRQAELRLRQLLFGDSVYSPGGLRGEDLREQANRQLRRMRDAFNEALDEGEQAAAEAKLAEDLLKKARRTATRKGGRKT